MFIRKLDIYTEQRVYPYVAKSDLRLDLLPRIRNMALSMHGANHLWLGADDDAILRSAKLIGRDPTTGKEGFNAAAVLLLGTDDCIGGLFPAYKTDCLLRRVNMDHYDDRVMVYGNLIEAYDKIKAFGVKAGFVTASRTNWVLGSTALSGNSYDGNTLAQMLKQAEEISGVKPQHAYCDLGYRGHDYGGGCDVQVVNRFRKRKPRAILRWWKRRSAIEPVIGYVKSDRYMERKQGGCWNRRFYAAPAKPQIGVCMIDYGIVQAWKKRRTVRMRLWRSMLLLLMLHSGLNEIEDVLVEVVRKHIRRINVRVS